MGLNSSPSPPSLKSMPSNRHRARMSPFSWFLRPIAHHRALRLPRLVGAGDSPHHEEERVFEDHRRLAAHGSRR